MRKEDKANFLFEELGNVDDEYLYESSGRPLSALAEKNKKRKSARILIPLLAASLSFSVLMLVVGYQMKNKPGNTVQPTEGQTSATPLPEEQKLPSEKEYDVLFETPSGAYHVGHTPEMLEVRVKSAAALQGTIRPVVLTEYKVGKLYGKLSEEV